LIVVTVWRAAARDCFKKKNSRFSVKIFPFCGAPRIFPFLRGAPRLNSKNIGGSGNFGCAQMPFPVCTMRQHESFLSGKCAKEGVFTCRRTLIERNKGCAERKGNPSGARSSKANQIDECKRLICRRAPRMKNGIFETRWVCWRAWTWRTLRTLTLPSWSLIDVRSLARLAQYENSDAVPVVMSPGYIKVGGSWRSTFLICCVHVMTQLSSTCMRSLSVLTMRASAPSFWFGSRGGSGRSVLPCVCPTVK